MQLKALVLLPLLAFVAGDEYEYIWGAGALTVGKPCAVTKSGWHSNSNPPQRKI